MADMRTALSGGYAEQMAPMIDPRYAGMTHTGQEPVGMDTVRAFQAMPGQIADWAQNNPLDAGALAVSPVPVVGDALGFANDMRHMIQNPEDRTWGNAALAGAGLLPFVPPMAGIVRGAKGAGDMASALGDSLNANKLSPMASALVAKTSATNPKTIAKALRKEGLFDGSTPDIADEVTEIKNKQVARSQSRQGPDPLIRNKATRGLKVKRLKAGKEVEKISGGLWSSKFAHDVEIDKSGGWDASSSINRANMEAVPRQLKKEGWTVRHASTGTSGKKSSRYVVSPDGEYEVRLSDHELPDTPQRAYSREQTGGPRWNDEVILYGDESPNDIISQIKRMYEGEE